MKIHKTASIDRFRKIEADKEFIFKLYSFRNFKEAELIQ
ncbi:hypothetical protein LBBP_02053 [Leptospira borgpetersenii serovar Ballum]|uniref:Uncharacterized protein n=1 Tax=Leptospira borgpetersenii serovar Ballum TaxID=280505 RepID=A0A0S2IRN5_LEPBO|nr:hypothetical protein LBBP_02053 [Leptospira borgpetersenii serovar Ballum]